MKVFRIIRFAFFMMLFFACTMESAYIDGIEEKIAEDKADDEELAGDGVVLLITQAGAGEVTLGWEYPDNPDFERLYIDCSAQDYSVEMLEDTKSYTYSGLTEGTRYTFTAESYFSNGSSDSTSISITLPMTTTSVSCLLTAEELVNVSNDVDGYYILINDLNLYSYSAEGGGDPDGWTPIGYGSEFTGTFDGNGHTISNLVVDQNTLTNMGLFYNVSGFLRYINIESANVNAQNQAGILAGHQAGGVISYCHTTGIVSGEDRLGGLVGAAENGNIEYCSSNVTISGNDFIGGITGSSDSNPLAYCFANVDIDSMGENLGGITGLHNGGQIYISYATGTLGATGSNLIGGIVGSLSAASADRCYAAVTIDSTGTSVGGIAGQSTGMVNWSHYDNDILGVASSLYGTAHTTAEMTDENNVETIYSDWDFDNIWAIDENNIINSGYPYLIDWPPR